MKYICDICDYVYDEELGDPENNIAPHTMWRDIPSNWVCPVCGVSKEYFSKDSLYD